MDQPDPPDLSAYWPDDGWVDLGHGHAYRLTVWSPDRALNPQYADVPDLDPVGAVVRHPVANGPGTCISAITFDLPGVAAIFPGHPVWTLRTLAPLDVDPSLLCRRCGDHGFIHGGRWVPA